MKKGDTFFLHATPVYIRGSGCCGGKKEGEGPLGHNFDHIGTDNRFECETWEKSEMRMVEIAGEIALKKAGLSGDSIDVAVGGDLLNQCISTSFAMRQIGVPFLGLYGACSTMAEGILVGSMLLAAGFGQNVLATASSHFCSAERQYRYPLEYGGQRPPSAQWTATASGAVVLSLQPSDIRVRSVTVGRVFDPGVTDASNMGPAMAQAAYESLKTHFRDTGTGPKDYDLIATGDLAKIGEGVVRRLFYADGVEMGGQYCDCGCMLYSQEQDVCAGASGCGCSAAVLCSNIIPKMKMGDYRRVLFAGTGALLSPVSTNQGESIPGICHVVSMEVAGQ